MEEFEKNAKPMENLDEQSDKEKRRKILIFIIGILFASILAAGMYLNWDKLFGGSKTGNILDLDPNMVSGLISLEEESTSNGNIAIPGYDVIKFKSGQKSQLASFYNPASNKCYFRISLYLPSGKLIYQSGHISPGYSVADIKLKAALVPGKYEKSKLVYECFAMDDNLSKLNGAEIYTTLQVI